MWFNSLTIVLIVILIKKIPNVTKNLIVLCELNSTNFVLHQKIMLPFLVPLTNIILGNRVIKYQSFM